MTALRDHYTLRLQHFFEKYAPQKVDQIDVLLKLNKGNESELMVNLALIYGPEPKPKPEQQSAATTPVPPPVVPPSTVIVPPPCRRLPPATLTMSTSPAPGSSVKCDQNDGTLTAASSSTTTTATSSFLTAPAGTRTALCSAAHSRSSSSSCYGVLLPSMHLDGASGGSGGVSGGSRGGILSLLAKQKTEKIYSSSLPTAVASPTYSSSSVSCFAACEEEASFAPSPSFSRSQQQEQQQHHQSTMQMQLQKQKQKDPVPADQQLRSSLEPSSNSASTAVFVPSSASSSSTNSLAVSTTSSSSSPATLATPPKPTQFMVSAPPVSEPAAAASVKEVSSVSTSSCDFVPSQSSCDSHPSSSSSVDLMSHSSCAFVPASSSSSSSVLSDYSVACYIPAADKVPELSSELAKGLARRYSAELTSVRSLLTTPHRRGSRYTSHPHHQGISPPVNSASRARAAKTNQRCILAAASSSSSSSSPLTRRVVSTSLDNTSTVHPTPTVRAGSLAAPQQEHWCDDYSTPPTTRTSLTKSKYGGFTGANGAKPNNTTLMSAAIGSHDATTTFSLYSRRETTTSLNSGDFTFTNNSPRSSHFSVGRKTSSPGIGATHHASQATHLHIQHTPRAAANGGSGKGGAKIIIQQNQQQFPSPSSLAGGCSRRLSRLSSRGSIKNSSFVFTKYSF